MNSIFAVAGVVIKEMYRRKDFIVLLILTVVITALMGSVNFFNDDKIVRYLEGDLPAADLEFRRWVIAIMTTARQIPAEKESRTIFPLFGEADFPFAVAGRQISRLLAGVRHCVALLLHFLWLHQCEPGASLAPVELFSGGPLCTGSCWALSSPWFCWGRSSSPRFLQRRPPCL